MHRARNRQTSVATLLWAQCGRIMVHFGSSDKVGAYIRGDQLFDAAADVNKYHFVNYSDQD